MDQGGRHRPIPRLIGDTFGVVGRRIREIAVIAIVAAAIAVVSFGLLTAATSILAEEILDNPEFEALMDLLAEGDSGDVDPEAVGLSEDDLAEWAPVNNDEVRVVRLGSDDATSEAWEDFSDSVDWGRVIDAVLLLVASFLVFVIGLATHVAFSLVTLDDVEGRPPSANRALATGFARLPKIVLLALAYIAAFLVMLVALGLVVLVGSLIHSVLGLLAVVAAIGVTVAALVVLVPLVEMHFVMAYVEPGFPSPARWWRLLAGQKLATWGRSVLILGGQIVLDGVLWLGLQSLPGLYGDFISNVIVAPVIAALVVIAFALMFADLSGRSQPPNEDWPALDN